MQQIHRTAGRNIQYLKLGNATFEIPLPGSAQATTYPDIIHGSRSNNYSLLLAKSNTTYRIMMRCITNFLPESGDAGDYFPFPA